MQYVRVGFFTLIRPICRLFFRVDIVGKMPKNWQRLLIVANHESFLDGFLLGVFLPIDPLYVVHSSVKKQWYFRAILKLVDHVAVDPSSAIAMKTVVHEVESGRPVVVFPEGRITTTGSLMKTYEGSAFVAAKTQATILPVRIDGAAQSYFSRLSTKNPQKFLPKITITILPTTAIPIDMEEEVGETDSRKKAADMMRRILQEMIVSSYPKQTLFEALLKAINIHGRWRRFMEDAKQFEYSYRDLLKISLMLGYKIAQGTKENERIGLLLPNSIHLLGAIFGLTAFGRCPALLNYTSGVKGLQSACKIADLQIILTSKTFLEQAKLEPLVASLQGKTILYLEEMKYRCSLLDKAWILFWIIFPNLAMVKRQPTDTAVVLFTSGTENTPKGVLLSHQALLANIAQIRAVINFSAEDKFLVILPYFHAFGLTAGALLPLFSGARLVLYPTPLHYKVIPEIAYDRDCTILFGTNTFLNHYATHAHPYDFYKLRYVVAGAEKLSHGVKQTWFEKFGIRILEGYGATEMSPVLSVNSPMAYRSNTVGQLLPSIQYQLTTVEGIQEGGLLHVKGPNIMTGYLLESNPGCVTLPTSSVGKGWYDTGDIVEIDSDGFVHILGRAKRFAKIAGEMISLGVTEAIARAASPEQLHAAIAQLDESRGETILLFTTDIQLTREALMTQMKALGYPELALPKKIIAVEELPLLGVGKVDYVALKKMAEPMPS